MTATAEHRAGDQTPTPLAHYTGALLASCASGEHALVQQTAEWLVQELVPA